MKIYTRVEWVWDGRIYHPARAQSFEYDGPVALLKSDAVGLGDFVDTAINHVQNVGKGYQKDPERAVLGINTTYETKLWEMVLGKEYDDALVGDLATEGSVHTDTDRKTAKEKGIDMGSTEFVDGIAQAIAIYYGGQAIGGAMSGSEGAALGAEEGSALVDTTPIDIPPGETSLAESTAGVSTSGNEALSGNAGADTATAPGSNVSPETGPQPEQLSGPGTPEQTAPTTASKGLIQSGLDWAQAHPTQALIAAQLASGVAQGIGSNMTQNQIADKKAKSDRELLAAKSQEEAASLEARRRFIQSGSYYSANVPMRAGPQQPLRRPDGSLVYTPNGLIATAMR